MGKLNQNFIMFTGDVLTIDFLHVGAFWTSHSQVVAINANDVAEWRLYTKDDPTDVKVLRTSAASQITFESSGYYGEIDDTFRVSLAAANTSALTPGDYEHQLLIKYGGSPVVVASGAVTLKKQSTTSP